LRQVSLKDKILNLPGTESSFSGQSLNVKGKKKEFYNIITRTRRKVLDDLATAASQSEDSHVSKDL
jgi:hypothetical protein